MVGQDSFTFLLRYVYETSILILKNERFLMTHAILKHSIWPPTTGHYISYGHVALNDTTSFIYSILIFISVR
jgi:hypothetical protein